jgi:mixed-linked glucan synthase
MAPQAPANGGAGNGGTAAGGAAPASANGAGHHGGSNSENNGVVAGGTTTAPPSVAANGNGKQRATRKRRLAVNPKDKYWTPIDEKEAAAAVEDSGEDGRRPLLFRTYRVKGILLHPYRCVYYHRIHPN